MQGREKKDEERESQPKIRKMGDREKRPNAFLQIGFVFLLPSFPLYSRETRRQLIGSN